MKYFLAVAIFFFCIPAIFAPDDKVRPIIYLATTGLVIALLGCSWPFIMPTNFLLDHPWAVDSPLHPALSNFCGGLAFLFSMGMFIALGCRIFFKYPRHRDEEISCRKRDLPFICFVMSAEPGSENEKSPRPPREFSGKKFVGVFLIVAAIFSALVLGLFYFHFFDVLKEYRKANPPPPRSVDRG